MVGKYMEMGASRMVRSDVVNDDPQVVVCTDAEGAGGIGCFIPDVEKDVWMAYHPMAKAENKKNWVGRKTQINVLKLLGIAATVYACDETFKDR